MTNAPVSNGETESSSSCVEIALLAFRLNIGSFPVNDGPATLGLSMTTPVRGIGSIRRLGVAAGAGDGITRLPGREERSPGNLRETGFGPVNPAFGGGEIRFSVDKGKFSLYRSRPFAHHIS